MIISVDKPYNLNRWPLCMLLFCFGGGGGGGGPIYKNIFLQWGRGGPRGGGGGGGGGSDLRKFPSTWGRDYPGCQRFSGF